MEGRDQKKERKRRRAPSNTIRIQRVKKERRREVAILARRSLAWRENGSKKGRWDLRGGFLFQSGEPL